MAACQSDPTQMQAATPSSVVATEVFIAEDVTPIPTVAIPTDTLTPSITPTPTLSPTVTPSLTLSPTVTLTSTNTHTPTITLTPIPTNTVTPTATATKPFRVEHYQLSRPIEQTENRVHWVDRTYPYGSTQFGEREVHLGVEFVNPRFTPILAAAAGQVVFAGQDDEAQYGPYLDYYGTLVVIEHALLSPDGLPVYTLYGHMQDVSVQTGDMVEQGQKIGRVGDSGIALGSHLHFEVRVGNPMDFLSTRNPELWLRPYVGYGVLAGNVVGSIDPGVTPVTVRNADLTREAHIYAGTRVNPDVSWNENFVLGDLPEGEYEIFIGTGGGRFLFRDTITIEAGQTTWIDIEIP